MTAADARPERLRALLRGRRTRERRAGDELRRRREAAAAAARDVEQAGRERRVFEATRRSAEATLYRAAEGALLSVNDLESLNRKLADLDAEAGRLDERLAADRTRLTGAEADARAAREAYLVSHRASERWRLLSEKVDRRSARRRDLLAETEVEEMLGDRAGRAGDARRA